MIKSEQIEITIAWLYSDLMSTYGDRGNVISLLRRCTWRGISVDVKELSLNSKPSELSSCDLLFMGGGEDRQQKIVAEDMNKGKAHVLNDMIQSGVPGLYICGAYQFLGNYYKEADGTIIEGLKILDVITENPGSTEERLIGNVIAQTNLLGPAISTTIIGFENHGGRTYLGEEVKPFATIIQGNGNNGDDGFEGAIYKNTIGSYCHGPLLPKNLLIADFLITKALEKKYGHPFKLSPLDDTIENTAHAAIARRLNVKV